MPLRSRWFDHLCSQKQSDDVDVMIASNSRARKWFEEQVRRRTIEQVMATLDQVRMRVTRPFVHSRLLAQCISDQTE